MTMTLVAFNQLDHTAAVQHLMTCCTSSRWAEQLAAGRPFADQTTLLDASDAIWQQMGEADYLEAFDGHPQIGDVSTLKAKYQNTQASAAHEQSGANEASEDTLLKLAQGNKDYLAKFGFIFIVFATGKSAAQMLALLQARLPNTREQELHTAAGEQNKITRLRLTKAFA